MGYKLKSYVSIKKIIRGIPSIIFLLFVAFTTIHTLQDEISVKLKAIDLSYKGFEELSNTLEDFLQENFYNQNEYINLNGLATRLLGINNLNEIQMLQNEQLSSFENAVGSESASKSIIQLNSFLDERKIEFLYVLVPSKYAFYDAEFAPGYDQSTAWQDIDSMIASLEEDCIDCIDMDAWYEENEWTIDDVYFKTDHHWKGEAAFAATHQILLYMTEEYGIEYDNSMANYDAWEVDLYEDYFLGSSGKRVGTKYAGVDDITIIYRKDQIVDLSYLTTGTTDWTYRNSVLDYEKLAECDYFNLSPYHAHIGGDYPIVNIKNENALNDMKILIIGDSFRLPVETYLVSYFTDLCHIDLSHYSDGTLAQYIEEYQPDIVLMCTNSVSGMNYTYGIDEYISALESTDKNCDIADLGDIEIKAQESNKNNFKVVCSNLEPGKTYTLTVATTVLSGSTDAYLQMTLQDLTENQAVCNRYFYADNYSAQKWIFTVPEDSDTYAIYLYAGTKDHTENAYAKVTGICLQKGIIED